MASAQQTAEQSDETQGVFADGSTWSEERYNLLMVVLLCCIIAVDVALANWTGLKGGFEGTLNAWFCVAALAALYCYSRWRQFPRFQEVCVLTAWAITTTNALSLLVQCAGRSPFPLVDADLAKIDAALNFSTGAVIVSMAQFPAISLAFAVIYAAIVPLILASIFLPTFCGRHRESQRYILSATIAGVITAAVFARWPAVGPWTVFGYAPTQAQADVQAYLVSVLRAGTPAQLDFRSSAIVSFPSFHAVLALLSVIALWNVRSIRYLVLAIAVGICISTVTTGWHYLIDLVGGVGVVLASHALSTWAMAALSGKATCKDLPR